MPDEADVGCIAIEGRLRAVGGLQPTEPQPPVGTDCIASMDCEKFTYGATGFIYFKMPELAVSVANINASQPTASTPVRIDVYASAL